MPEPIHVSDPGSPGLRHRPESPRFFSGGLIVRGEKPANALLAAGGPGNDEVTDDQRRRRGVVVLPPVRHFGIPQQFARESIEREQVRMIRHHEYALARNRDTSVDAPGGIADETFGARLLKAPDLAAVACIERVTLVRAGDVHDAVDDNRRHLQAQRRRDGIDPFRRQTAYVRFVDLREGGIAVACRRPVVARPIDARRDDAIAVAGFSEKNDRSALRPQLYVVRALVIEKNSLDRATVGQLVRRRPRTGRRRRRLLGKHPGTQNQEPEPQNRRTQNLEPLDRHAATTSYATLSAWAVAPSVIATAR